MVISIILPIPFFQLKQKPFSLTAADIAAVSAAFPDNTVAGNDYQQGIFIAQKP